MARDFRVTINLDDQPLTETMHETSIRTITIREICQGHHDDLLEDILEAAHHRKREIRDRRTRR